MPHNPQTGLGKSHNLRDCLEPGGKDIFIRGETALHQDKKKSIRNKQLAQDAGPDLYNHL